MDASVPRQKRKLSTSSRARARSPLAASSAPPTGSPPATSCWRVAVRRAFSGAPKRCAAASLRSGVLGALLAAAVSFRPLPAQAFPGVIAGKGDAQRVTNSTQVVLLKKNDHTVVTVWSDYEGRLDRFALVLPVPADVKLAAVKSLKRDAIDHLDEISAPRFHEFWEMDPCESGEAEQEWERNLEVKDSAVNFLGGGLPDVSGGQKLPPEMLLDLEPQFKDGEYTFALVPKRQSVQAYLAKKGLTLPAGAAEALARYDAAGMQMLVAEVATSKVELAGAQRALLSPIRFATREPYSIPSTLGLANSAGKQELIVYVLHPERRFEVANYPNAFPPTNVNVDFGVKERLGEFYAGVHDALSSKAPKTFLVEYAWPTIKHCGEPCPNAPMAIHELMSLGVDILEADVPAPERNPKPAEPSEEEQAQLKAADKKTRKRLEEQRREVARRRGLLERNNYVITRLHHRYDRAALPQDIEVQPAGHVRGGLGAPVGPNAELAGGVEPSAESRLQVRYVVAHPSKRVAQCDNPQRWRWGKAPASYRGLRKTWTARDLAYKKRDKFVLAEVIESSVPALGIKGSAAAEPPSAPVASEAKEDSGCALRGSAGRERSSALVRAGFMALVLMLSRRRAAKPGKGA